MKTKLKPIKPNEQGNNVNLLHQVLSAFGFTVSQKEVSKNIAGNDTIKLVRELQRLLKVRFDDAFVVDKPTSLAISKALVDRGLTSTRHSFKVRSSLPNNKIGKRN